jgi:FMN phosphatase YigB (HAD superfamily)
MKHKSYKPVIVLDVGSVLVAIDPKRALRDLSRKSGIHVGMLNLDDLDTVFLPFYLGKQAWPETVESVNRILGISLKVDEWRQIWCSIIVGEIPGMRQSLGELKDEFTLVALSNTDEVHWNYVLTAFPIFQLLDGWIVSFEEGVMKPDPAIYERLMDRYGNGKPPCYYTDDIPQFVEASRNMGWDAEVFTDAARFKQEVTKRKYTGSHSQR